MEFKNYFKNIKNKIEQSTEYTLRTDFENLLNEIKPEKTISIIQESKKTENQTFGKPDFKITQNDLEIGWDGKAKGGDKYVKPGIYTYTVRYKDIYEIAHEQAGMINVIR